METVRLSGPAGQYDVPLHRAPMSTRFLQGAGLAGAMSVLRLLPLLGKSLTLSQVCLGLLAVSIGGGVGGLIYYSTDAWRVRGRRWRTLANVVSLLAYCFATIGLLLLLGPVLGIVR